MTALGFRSGVTVRLDNLKVILTPKSSTKSKETNLSEDQVNVSIKSGFIPTFKGSSTGLAFGALGAGVAASVAMKLAEGENGWGVMPVIISTAIGGSSGALSGGVIANLTSNKLVGIACGALTGAAAMALYRKDLSGVFVGAISGVMAGLAGATMAKK
jgi:hypothetical protein